MMVGLLRTGRPFGYEILVLFGIIASNSIILTNQIEIHLAGAKLVKSTLISVAQSRLRQHAYGL